MNKDKYFIVTMIACIIISIASVTTSFASTKVVPNSSQSNASEDFYSGPAGELVFGEDLGWQLSNEDNVAASTASKPRRGQLIGRFKTTAYSSDPRGGATGKTATGTVPRINHTVAANFREIAPGTRVMLEGSDIIYTVEDTGNYTNLIDVFLHSHEAAIQYGVKYRNVYLVAE